MIFPILQALTIQRRVFSQNHRKVHSPSAEQIAGSVAARAEQIRERGGKCAAPRDDAGTAYPRGRHFHSLDGHDDLRRSGCKA